MPEVLVRFTEAIQDESGASYGAQACGSVGPDGLWEGWVEFVSENGTAFRSPRETEQPNRTALVYWAEGLTATYLEGALRRALDALTPPTVRNSATEPSIFDSPAPAIRATRLPRLSHPVLDPFATYEEGQSVLRQQLAALSRDHLLAIIEAYALPVVVSVAATDRDLIDGIVVAVARLEGRSTSQS